MTRAVNSFKKTKARVKCRAYWGSVFELSWTASKHLVKMGSQISRSWVGLWLCISTNHSVLLATLWTERDKGMPGCNLMQVLAYKYFINLRKVSILGSLITGNHFWVYQIVIRIWVPQTNNTSYHTINKLLTNVNKPIKIMEETELCWCFSINTNSILTIPVVPQGIL